MIELPDGALYVRATINLQDFPAGLEDWVDANDPWIQGLLAERYLIPVDHPELVEPEPEL